VTLVPVASTGPVALVAPEPEPAGEPESEADVVPEVAGSEPVAEPLAEPVAEVGRVPAAEPTVVLAPLAAEDLEPVVEPTAASASVSASTEPPAAPVAHRPVAPATVVASTGQRFQIIGRALLGRRPSPAPDERYDAILVLVDDGKTVSKTHFELTVDDRGIHAIDLGSGNGTVIEIPGEPSQRCVPGVPMPVPRGARIVLGRQFLVVS